MKDNCILAKELILDLKKSGVELWTEEGKLKYRDRSGNFDLARKEKVKELKENILKVLENEKKMNQIVHRTITEPVPLTKVQAAYLLGKSDAVFFGGVGCQGYMEVNFGSYSPEKIKTAWRKLVERHAMLRAKVKQEGIEFLEPASISFETEIVDLRGKSKEEREQALEIIRNSFRDVEYDTQTPPLFKTLITQTEEGNYFHLSIDLIVTDFASVQLAIGEMGTILSGGKLKELELTFADYVLHECKTKEGLKWFADKEYWMNRIDSLPQAPVLPSGGRAEAKMEGNNKFRRLQKHLSLENWNQLKSKAAKAGVTASTVVLAVYAETIARWSENKKFTLNLPIQNRMDIHEDVQYLVGDFTTVNLLEVDVTKKRSFTERVKSIAAQLHKDLEHTSFTGIEVLRELSNVHGREKAFMPIVFTGVLKAEGKAGSIEYGLSQTPQVFIDCQVVDESELNREDRGLMISWDIRNGAIKDVIVNEMFDTFYDTLEGLHQKQWNMPLELEISVNSHDAIEKKITHRCLQDDFIEYAKKNPSKTALYDGQGTMSFGQLLEGAENIAAYVQENVQGTDSKLISIEIPKSAKQIMAALGVLMAGYTYLPIDMKQPKVRQEKIIAQALVAERMDEAYCDLALEKGTKLELQPAEYNKEAYVIFTSGSTGDPKGVVMSHEAAINTIETMRREFDITEEDRVLGIAELSFDLSVSDIFTVLANGGQLILPDPAYGPDASYWSRLIEEYHITLWNTVPAQAEMLVAYAESTGDDTGFPSVKNVWLSGDWIQTKLPQRLRKFMPNAAITSLGGATEGGIWSIYHRIGKEEESPSILYGKALKNQWVSVVDINMEICPAYVSGEIIIGGNSLAEGYLGDKELTDRKFVNRNGERVYLTGDRGRFVATGDIEFLGRMDNQVKVNGYRIELGEIEAALAEMTSVKESCVVHFKEGGKDTLAAFVVEQKEQNREKQRTQALNFPTEEQEDFMSRELVKNFQMLLDEAICNTVYGALQSIFTDDMENANKMFTREAIGKKLHAKEKHMELLDRWLETLVQKGYLGKKEKVYRDLLERKVTNEYWDKLINEPYSAIAPACVSEYIKNHASHIKELFADQLNPLTYLFPEGRTDIAEALYGQTAIARHLNSLAAKTIQEYAKGQEHIKVLEVGGGIGATTDLVLEALKGSKFTYTFTDTSAFFQNNILSKYPYLTTGILNLDDLEQAGMESSFDVILAAGVLNNVKNIPYTIGKLASYLKQGGLLLITEPVEEHIEILVSQAFMMPEHTDMRQGTARCFLSKDEWKKVLEDAGLWLAKAYPDTVQAYEEFQHYLFIARKPEETADYREFLEKRLIKAMIPEKFYRIDALPLTANGKVDRKALTQQALSRQKKMEKYVKENEQMNPKEEMSELEHKIAAILEEVSNKSSIQVKDNLLKAGFDSLILSQASGKIVSQIEKADGMRFDEILRVALQTPTIKDIANYIEEYGCKVTKKEEENGSFKEEQQADGMQNIYVYQEKEDSWWKMGQKEWEEQEIFLHMGNKEQLRILLKERKEDSVFMAAKESDVKEMISFASELLAMGYAVEKLFLFYPAVPDDEILYLGDAVVIGETRENVAEWEDVIMGEIQLQEIKLQDGNMEELVQIVKRELGLCKGNM